MLLNPLLISPTAAFWTQVARVLPTHESLAGFVRGSNDFSALRVVVPSFHHASQLKAALAGSVEGPFIPPRISTLDGWLAMLPPDDSDASQTSRSARMMSLYAELRQHAWLKKLFSARRNTDLLPLAQTLLALFDELSSALLPAIRQAPGAAEERWQAALEQLPPPARTMLSDESQLVWTLWKTQLDGHDPVAACMTRLVRLAEAADAPLVWIAPERADGVEAAFLQEYAKRQPVLPVAIDWHADAVAPLFAEAWSEMLEEGVTPEEGVIAAPPGIALFAANGLESEAQHAAQTVIGWLAEGKTRIAIIAQDRVVARRIRALLERAGIFVSDETGWKLSTTRAAASLAALLDVVTTRAETVALLDLLKSPSLFAALPDKEQRVLEIEHALRRNNVLGGWEAALGVLNGMPDAQAMLSCVAVQARGFAGRKTLADWRDTTDAAMRALGMRDALEADAAGKQVVALLDMLSQDCAAMSHLFSFAEWRAFLSLQLESTPFMPEDADRRVAMLQLNGARLRSFDAVIMVGADADHLPSQVNETLFFANAVRRELGLATREMRQRTQLRDFAELLSVSTPVVLSSQSFRDGEPNALSAWIERLQLTLERAGRAPLPVHRVAIDTQSLTADFPVMPKPRAARLVPSKLSASGYNSLVACPYQFFATRMLRLDALDELSDMPEKRDYGDWLHEILRTFHETLRDKDIGPGEREALLRRISQDVFDRALAQSGAALGYYARWQKVIPAYLQWAGERELQGWRFVSGEQRFERTLALRDGPLTLHGYVDRIDENEDGERAVLDYKTKNLQALRDKLKDMEDHQLAFYGILSDRPVTAGHFVALELTKDKTGDAPAKNFGEWQVMLNAQIVNTIDAIGRDAQLPATGIERTCAYCEVRGLCRKGAW